MSIGSQTKAEEDEEEEEEEEEGVNQVKQTSERGPKWVHDRWLQSSSADDKRERERRNRR